MNKSMTIMTQRLINMYLCYNNWPITNGLRTLFATLILLVFPMGVWGQTEDVVEINQLSDLSSILGNWVYNLQDGKTYKLNVDINTAKSPNFEKFSIEGGRIVTIDLNGHTLSAGAGEGFYYSAPFISNNGTLVIKNGTISGGRGNDNAGGIRNNGILTLEDVTVTGNTSTGNGGVGGIYNNGTLYIKGNTMVTGNMHSNAPASNIYLPDGKVIYISDNITGAANGIGITMATRGTFTSGLNGHGVSNQFSSDVAGLEIATTEGGEAKIITVWEVLQQQLNTEGESSGTVTLDQDYTAISGDIPLEISGTVMLNLNGHTIDRGLGSSSATANGEVINITSGGNLTITGTGTITGGNVSGNGGAIINAGTLTVSGGTITGNSATGNGGAIFNTGTATISGGTLSSNSASQGGAIYNNGTLTVSSGAIQNNTASTNGGGIYHYDGTLNMSGAPTISGNQKGTADNNVYLSSGKTITVNADLTNTTAIGITMAANTGEFTTGLGSYTGDYQNFTSDDNRFLSSASGSEAKLQTYWMDLQEKLDAGNVILARNYEYLSGFDNAGLTVSADRTLNLGSYKIDRKLSTATEDGYVIKVAAGGTLTVTGTGTITGGNNTGNGGGILNEGTLVLSGGSITGNIAATGGGIYNGGTLQMSGAPTVKNNTGGNIYLPDGHATITLTATLNGTDGNIGVTMKTPGTFTSGLNTYGTIAKFFSDNSAYTVILSGDEATLMTHWNALKAAFAAGGDVNLTRNYTAPANDYLTVDDSKTVTLDLKGHTIDRGLSSAAAVADGYVIKVNTGCTLTIKDTGSNGRIIGGNNTGNGGGILNEGTLNIQGGTITNNSAANGGAIYNSGTLTISGGTIQGNTATTNGGAIYHNGTSFSLQGSPTITNNRVSSTDNNVYLAATKIITISGILNNTNAIGIVCADDHLVFTTGLSGKGNASKFTSNQTGKGIGLNSAGEAIFGTSYTITREESNSSYTYMYIKGNYIDNEIAAVEGEYVKVTISGDGNYHTVPVSLSYTDGNTDVVLSSYPMGGVEYGFIMPAEPVTVTGLCLYGGYCGNANNEDVKFYLDGTTLKFVGKDESGYQMKTSYTSVSDVPWYNMSAIRNAYTSVEIASNVTSISPYAFFGSNLATIDLPSTVTSIGTFAFGNCQKLKTLTVADANTQYQAVNNVLYEESTGNPTNLICYPAGIEVSTYTLPSTVTAITDGAFAFNNLESITVAGGSSFSAPNDNGVLYNAAGTILYCYPARKTGDVYDVASTVTEIKPYAFHNNNLLKAVNFCETTVPTGGTEMFGGSNTAKIMVTKGLKSGDGDNYSNTAPWSTANYMNRTYEMDLANAVVSLAYDTYSYDDYAYEPVKPAVSSVTLTTGNLTQTLRSGIDYVAINDGSYSHNTAVGNATVTITGAGGYAGTSKDRNFAIYRHLSISGATNYFTYYANEDLSKYHPEYYHAYTITAVNWTTGEVTLSELDYIPANKPVLVYSPNYSHCQINNDYYFTAHAAGSPTEPCANFKGETTAKTLEQLKTENNASEIYVLRGNNFVRATSGTLKARHCYLWKPIGGGGADAPARLSISFDDNTTNIDMQTDSTNDSITNSNWYTLDGRKLDERPTKKGVYINNGKKVVVK